MTISPTVNKKTPVQQSPTVTATTSNGQKSFKEKRKKKQTPAPDVMTVSVIPVELPVDVRKKKEEQEKEEEEEDPADLEPQTVSVTSCLFVISSFVIGGAILFSIWEVYFHYCIYYCN